MDIDVVKREIWHWGGKELPISSAAGKAIGVLAFSLMTALGAFVYIPLPFTPVPITLQTFFVLLSGAFLGKGGGALSQGMYILMGSVGLPVWAGGASGLSRLWGPTGGYLLGFLAAAWVVGHLMERNDRPSWSRIWGAMIVGSLMIYAFGLLQLSVGCHWSLKKSLMLGMVPFLPGDLIKLATASLIYRKLSSR